MKEPANRIGVDDGRYGNGRLVAPMLIVSGRGVAAWELAESIYDRCGRRRVEAVLKTIDDRAIIGEVELFPSLALVLSSQARPADFARFAALVTRYREERPHSAREALRPDAERWYAGGVLHVIFPNEALADATATGVINQACANYSFDALGEADVLFEIYRPGAVARRDSVALVADGVWGELGLWGVRTLDDALVVKGMIDRRCAVLEDPSEYPSMYRPIRDEPMNALQLVLHKPDLRPVALPGQDQKKVNDTYMDTGSRAIRDLITEVKKVLPDFDRPEHRQGRKGAQDDLRRLYDLLRSVILRS